MTGYARTLLRLPGTYAGHFELALLAQILYRPICLLQPGYAPFVFPVALRGQFLEQPPLFICSQNDAYVALPPRDNKVSLTTVLESLLVDEVDLPPQSLAPSV